MKNISKRLLLVTFIIFNSPVNAFLPTLKTAFTQNGPTIARQAYPALRIVTRHFSFSSKQIFTKVLQNTKSAETLKTLYKAPEHHRMVGYMFAQRLGLNTAAALGAMQGLGTGFLMSTAIYGTAFGHAVRGTLREYRHFLHDALIRTELNAIKTAQKNLAHQVTGVETNLSNRIIDTTRVVEKTELALQQQIKGTESILSTQISKAQGALDARILGNKELLEELKEKLQFDSAQLAALAAGQQKLSEQQQKILDVFLKTLPTETLTFLGRQVRL